MQKLSFIFSVADNEVIGLILKDKGDAEREVKTALRSIAKYSDGAVQLLSKFLH